MTEGGSFRKILVAVDGSEPSIQASERAIGLARDAKASLTAVSVVHVPTSVYAAAPLPGAAFDHSDDLRDYLMTQARGVLARVAEIARKEGVSIETKVLEGHVPSELLKYAEKGGHDLLVVGSRGLSGVGRLLLGSVSTALVHRAKISVLVVR